MRYRNAFCDNGGVYEIRVVAVVGDFACNEVLPRIPFIEGTSILQRNDTKDVRYKLRSKKKKKKKTERKRIKNYMI